jgi:hypothetical protein
MRVLANPVRWKDRAIIKRGYLVVSESDILVDTLVSFLPLRVVRRIFLRVGFESGLSV